MPILIQPDPPPPMSVRIATRVFGSEVLVSLIQHYRAHPRTNQLDAAGDLGLNRQTVSTNVRVLLDSAVLVDQRPPTGADGRARYYRVDEQRVRELLEALTKYVLED